VSETPPRPEGLSRYGVTCGSLYLSSGSKLRFDERSLDPPLLAEESKDCSLTHLVVLLRVQLHRGPRATTVVHEPHRKRQLRERTSDESVCDPRPVALARLWWCSHQISKMSKLPVNIASLV